MPAPGQEAAGPAGAARRSRFVAVGGVVFSRGAGSVLNLAVNLLLGRTLGAAGAGLFYLFNSWANILGTVGSLGLPMYVLRHVSVAVGRGTGGRTLLLRAVRVVVAVGVVLLVPTLLWGEALAGFFLQDPALGFVLALAAVGGAALAVTRVGAEALKALRRPGTGIALEFVVAPGALVVFLSVGLAGLAPMSASGAVWSFTLGLLLAGGAALALALGRLPSGPERERRFRRRALVSFWGIGLVNTLMATAPYLLLPRFASVAEIGRFGVAHRLVALSATILAALASHFAPRFAERRAAGDAAGLRREFRASRLCSALLFAPFLAAFVLAPRPILALFGSEFAAAAPLLIVLAVGRAVNSGLGLTEHMLSMTGHEGIELLSAAIALGAFAATAAVLGSGYGVAGVTWCYAGAFALRSGVSYGLVRRLVLGGAAPAAGPTPRGAAGSRGGAPEREAIFADGRSEVLP